MPKCCDTGLRLCVLCVCTGTMYLFIFMVCISNQIVSSDDAVITV